MRLGILQTGSVLEKFRSRHGDYPSMLRSLLGNADPSGRLRFEDYDVRVGTLPSRADACDGYVITGSRESVYAEHEWIRRLSEFVRDLHLRRRKVVGICFGHQLIAHALGGSTGRAKGGWAVGVHTSRVVANVPWMEPAARSFSLISSHEDQVERLPPDAMLIATNDFCPNAAFQLGEHMLAFQGHPEFTKEYSRDLMNSRRDLIGRERHREGIASLARATDEARVARWILNFLADGAERPRC